MLIRIGTVWVRPDRVQSIEPEGLMTLIGLRGSPSVWTKIDPDEAATLVNEALNPQQQRGFPPKHPPLDQRCKCDRPTALMSDDALVPYDAWLRCAYCRKLF